MYAKQQEQGASKRRNIIHYHKNMPDREGWTTLKKIEFNSHVEEW